jgi:hypothetical protein
VFHWNSAPWFIKYFQQNLRLIARFIFFSENLNRRAIKDSKLSENNQLQSRIKCFFLLIIVLKSVVEFGMTVIENLNSFELEKIGIVQSLPPCFYRCFLGILNLSASFSEFNRYQQIIEYTKCSVWYSVTINNICSQHTENRQQFARFTRVRFTPLVQSENSIFSVFEIWRKHAVRRKNQSFYRSYSAKT